MNSRYLLLIFSIALISFSAFAQTEKSRNDRVLELCKSVGKIKQLPNDPSEKGVDSTYDAIVEAGSAVVPCLIDNITITKVMTDPRCPTISKGTTVGDVSYFVLVDILKIDFVKFLPADVVESYKTNGAYAYHDYIDRRGARKELQAKLRNWYDANQLKSK